MDVGCGKNDEYCVVWVDDFLYAGKSRKELFEQFEELCYKLKGVGEPK